jgi:hypothetical protein
MTKRVLELLPSMDVIMLKRLGVLTGQWRFIDPKILGAELVEYLRPVGIDGDRIFLRSRSGPGTTFRVHWSSTTLAKRGRPWFVCTCGRNQRRLFCADGHWACRYCHELTYASHLDPNKRKWSGVGRIRSILRKLGAHTSDPLSPLPPRPWGMWRDTYAVLAEEYMVAQQNLAESVARTARWAAIRRADQLAAGRRRQEREDRRDRTLDLNYRIRQLFNPAAVLSGAVDPPSDAELAEFEQLQTHIPELDDVERLKAAQAQPNLEAQRAVERLQLRRGCALLPTRYSRTPNSSVLRGSAEACGKASVLRAAVPAPGRPYDLVITGHQDSAQGQTPLDGPP